MTTPQLPPELIPAAREWVADCQWGEDFDDDDIARLTPEQLSRGVQRHYAGGITQFIADGQP